ncbi:hypothetical protein [Pyrodictium abyssi]|uniref:Adhesin domain-containing protein n=1 Tax=Pyrodictium abyssi TaxID=54256 RepID=A0ABN6ZPP1_9CREN|nr:hypothetical protein PABY_17780 [Pyrodictium abyssi]
MDFQAKLLLAAAIVLAAMGVGVVVLHGVRLPVPGYSCSGWSEETLYSGPMPDSLSLDVDVAYVRVYYSPEVTNAIVLLRYSGDCVHGDAWLEDGELRIEVRDTCRLHMDSCGEAALTVVLPEPSLDMLSLVLDVGKTELRDIAARIMTVSTNVGEVIAYNITIWELLEASTNVGRVALRGVYMPEDAVARLNANVGSVELHLATPGAWIENAGGGTGVSVTHAACPPARGPHIYASASVGNIEVTCRGRA